METQSTLKRNRVGTSIENLYDTIERERELILSNKRGRENTTLIVPVKYEVYSTGFVKASSRLFLHYPEMRQVFT